MADLLTTAQVAAALGVTQRRVQVLIAEGRLPAQTFGRMKLIRPQDVATVQERTPGRPHKGRASMFTTVTDAYQYYSDLHGSDAPVWTRDQLHEWLQENTGKPVRDLTEEDIRSAYDASLCDA